MAQPITPDEHGRIVELIRAGLPRNEIARRSGRSKGTVSRVAAELGHTFDRATGPATEARRADLAERRARLAEGLLDDAERLRAALWAPYSEARPVVTGRGVVEIVTIHHDQPSPADRDRIMRAAGTATARALDIERHDRPADHNGADVDRWIAVMTGTTRTGENPR